MIPAPSYQTGIHPLERQSLRRKLALAGIILIVLNLRPAITSLPPIYDQINQSIPLTPATLGLVGMLPPLAFAFFGSLTPRLLSKLQPEKAILLAMALVFIGQFIRSFSNSFWVFAITSTLSLSGMGMGNVLIPPVIKRYFPDHIGAVMSVYASLIAVSAALPSLIAVPVTQAMGWRFSTGMWAGIALVAMVPWLLLGSASQKLVEKDEHKKFSAWRWPTTWAITILFGVGVLNNYTMIAWLPKILTTIAGVNQATAGTMLSLYNLIGIPHGLLVPAVLSRTKRPLVVITIGILCMILGYLGLIFLPIYAWLWIFPAGIGLMLVPIGLTMINLRSRTEDGATVLSGLTQGAGYFMAAAGPIAVGGLHSIFGNWTTAFWFLLFTTIVAFGAGIVAAKPKFIEDS